MRKLILLLLIAISMFSVGAHICAPLPNATTREVYLMGTTFRATLFEPDHAKALQQLEQIVDTIEAAEHELSTWREDSELSRFNRQPVGQPFDASSSLCSSLQKVQKLVNQTNGAFDPTIGKLAQVWGIHGQFRIPAAAEIQAALQQTGFNNIQLESCRITKSKDVAIDPGGFGKGEALDRALAVSQKENFAPLLLDFGGQLAVRAYDTEATIADPFERSKNSGVTVHFDSGSLSTSGGSERDGYVNGKRIGHILDPHTGYPAASFGSVTVWRESAAEADILSTALYVMGVEQGFQWARENHIAACFLTGKESRTTPEFSALLR